MTQCPPATWDVVIVGREGRPVGSDWGASLASLPADRPPAPGGDRANDCKRSAANDSLLSRVGGAYLLFVFNIPALSL
jgi:hypothetical protein